MSSLTATPVKASSDEMVTMSKADLMELLRQATSGQAAEQAAEPRAKQAAKPRAKQAVKDYLGPQLTIKHTTRNFRNIVDDLKKCGIPVCGLKSVPAYGSITLKIDYENATKNEVGVLKAILETSLKRKTIKFPSGKKDEYYQPRILHGQECYARKFLGIEEPSEPSRKGKQASEQANKGKQASKPTNKGKPASKPIPKGSPPCHDQRLYLTIESGELEDQAKRLQGEHSDIFSGYQFTKKGDKIKIILREDVDPSSLKSFLDDGNTSLIPKEKEGQINAILSMVESEEEPEDEPEEEPKKQMTKAQKEAKKAELQKELKTLKGQPKKSWNDHNEIAEIEEALEALG